MSLWAVVVAVVLCGFSGFPGLVLGRGSRVAEWIATTCIVLGCLVGGAGAVRVLALATEERLSLVLGGSGGVELSLRADAISAVFLLPVFLIAALGAIYGLGYWPERDHPDDGRKLRLAYGLITAGLAALLVASNTILFLVAWEIMALAAFVAVSTEDRVEAVRQSGYVYLVATRAGTLCLIAMFLVMRAANGSFDFALTPHGAAQHGVADTVFVLGLIGFGLKAGIMPFHVWLPGAHANAPSHVSALMSGVLIKSGIYGLVRIGGLLPHPPAWWGGTILALGIVSGVLGVAFAIAQHDLKRLLAYHSVENIGIIAMGLGVAVLGRSLGRDDWVSLGLAGALLHVWNHGLFKALLFLSAGSVIHSTGTREIDRLGGLARKMPFTAAMFLVGAVAICGLPPLNGFVSELFVYLGLFRIGTHGPGATLLGGAAGAPALAMIGALAVACFAKAFSTVFLGAARSELPSHAHEAPRSMLVPMGVLAVCCASIGLAPMAIVEPMQAAVAAWRGPTPPVVLYGYAPLAWLSVMAGALLSLIVVLAWVVRRRGEVPTGPTWDCGYAAPRSSMQYTASSFADGIVAMFRWALRPDEHRPRIEGPFPTAARFESHVPEPVLDRLIMPVVKRLASGFLRLRWMQQGRVQTYLVLVLAALVLALLWAGVRQ